MPLFLANEVTFTFKEDVNAFTTFKSYIPDWGLSLNNRYYTFKEGSIWEHNVETDETITQKSLSEPITLTYEKTDPITKDVVFTITGDIVGLKLRSDERVRITFFDETSGRYYEERLGFIPDPDIDGPEIRLYADIDNNISDIELNVNNDYRVFILDVINLNVIPRNVFYNDDTQGSVVEFIMNTDPSTIKEFKTLGYEGIGLWDFQVFTDVESEIIDEDEIPKRYNTGTLAGVVQKEDLVLREGKYFANINGSEKDVTNLDFSSISVQGIGTGSPTGIAGSNQIQMDQEIAREVKVNYSLFYFENIAAPGETITYSSQLKFAGTISSIEGSVLTYDPGLTGEDPGEDDFFLYASNNLIEKSGVKGAYAHIRMTNDDGEHAEIYSVNSQVVQSSK